MDKIATLAFRLYHEFAKHKGDHTYRNWNITNTHILQNYTPEVKANKETGYPMGRQINPSFSDKEIKISNSCQDNRKFRPTRILMKLKKAQGPAEITCFSKPYFKFYTYTF